MGPKRQYEQEKKLKLLSLNNKEDVVINNGKTLIIVFTRNYRLWPNEWGKFFFFFFGVVDNFGSSR